jgi:hypothetical protein
VYMNGIQQNEALMVHQYQWIPLFLPKKLKW